jgi:hypothetical protein
LIATPIWSVHNLKLFRIIGFGGIALKIRLDRELNSLIERGHGSDFGKKFTIPLSEKLNRPLEGGKEYERRKW